VKNRYKEAKVNIEGTEGRKKRKM